jgi:uncharacterized damage-inducible protein DinB
MTTATLMPTLTETLLKELDNEAATTRKFLAILPEDKYDWKPHQKSMGLCQLATHVAELQSWVTLALTTDGLDFAKEPYTPVPVTNNQELLAYFERAFAEGRAHLAKAKDEDLLPDWTLRSGEQIFMVQSKGDTIRHAISQTIHHRAQLGVYLRLLNIPIPGSYGPSADEMGM